MPKEQRRYGELRPDILNILNKPMFKRNYKKEILAKQDLKEAHIFCKANDLKGCQFGHLIENYIGTKYNLIKNKPSECKGDLIINNNNIEIKVSLGGINNNNFQYGQIRLSHNCDYILTAYYLDFVNYKQAGELYIFKLNKKQMIKLILKYGGYSHGTKSRLGKITRKNIKKQKNAEYSLKFKYNNLAGDYLLQFRIKDINIWEYMYNKYKN